MSIVNQDPITNSNGSLNVAVLILNQIEKLEQKRIR
jgi:hypothetical protein